MPSVREFAYIVKEADYGVFNSSAASTDKAYLMLPQDNAVTVRKKVPPKDIVSAGRRGQRVRREGRTYDVSGTINTMLYRSQMPLWVSLLFNPAGTTCPDLGSFSLVHGFVLDEACTYNVTQYTGLKADWTLSGSDESQNVMLALEVVGAKATALADEAYVLPDSDDVPELEASYGFQDSAGHITFGLGTDGTASSGSPTVRKKYSSFELKGNNVYAPYRGETAYLQAYTWESRNPTLTLKNIYRSRQDRVDYESQNARPATLGLFPPDGGTLNFAFGRVYVNEPSDDLKMAGRYEQTVPFDIFADPVSGVDMTVTYTAPVTP